MKKKFILSYKVLGIFILFISLFLQSCKNSPVERKKQKIEDNKDKGKEKITNENEEEIELEEERLGINDLAPELILKITSYLKGKDLQKMKFTNANIRNTLGNNMLFGQTGLKLNEKDKDRLPKQASNWTLQQEINFKSPKMSNLTPETMHTLFFYRMLGSVANLPEEFWPYIKGSNIHTLTFSTNVTSSLTPQELEKLATNIKGTKVRRIVLDNVAERHGSTKRYARRSSVSVPVPYSTIKGFADILSKTNIEEFDVNLTHLTTTDTESLTELAATLLQTGVKKVSLTVRMDLKGKKKIEDLLNIAYPEIIWDIQTMPRLKRK